MTSKFIAIIQMGAAIPPALNKYGDFDQWFIDGMLTKPCQTKTYRVFENLTFPDVDDLAGVIVTGSSAMVTEERSWSEATIKWLRPLLDKDIPILGVCYGHQLLAKLLGGRVDWNPKGRQIGQIKMDLTEATVSDKLFKGLIKKSSNSLEFLATHQQSVIKLPSDVPLLGATKLDPNHCYRYKHNIWGLQFHPEFTPEIIKEYILARSKDIIKEGLDPKQIIEQITTIVSGKQLLLQFRDICFST